MPAPPESMRREGLAMLTALAADFRRIAGVDVCVLWDAKVDRGALLADCPLTADCLVDVASAADEQAAFARLAAESAWTVVIAPEFGGILASRCESALVAGGRLLGSSLETIAIASDKHHCAELLLANGVPVPFGCPLEPGQTLPEDFPYPAVLKPRDGAGSQGIRLIERTAELRVGEPSRLEQFCPGVAASVALLCGPRQQLALAPCGQRLSDDGRFSYQGGWLPLDANLSARATRLARWAIASLPCPLGYLGVDLVLGPDPTGRDDVVVEINPRLTTSYVGLRAATQDNLAAAMLTIASGERDIHLCSDFRPLQFDLEGRVQFLSMPKPTTDPAVFPLATD